MMNDDSTLNAGDIEQLDDNPQTEKAPQAKATDTVKRPVVYYPDPILEKVATPVEFGFTPGIEQLLTDMKETMIVGGGLGISAPQIGDSLRVFITRQDCVSTNDVLDQPVRVYINPEVTPGHKRKLKAEGCMSFPGVMVTTQRSTNVVVVAYDENGTLFSERLSGLQAHVVQHEMNHLDGITLYTRMTDVQKIRNRKSLQALRNLRVYHARMAAKATTDEAVWPDETTDESNAQEAKDDKVNS